MLEGLSPSKSPDIPASKKSVPNTGTDNFCVMLAQQELSLIKALSARLIGPNKERIFGQNNDLHSDIPISQIARSETQDSDESKDASSCDQSADTQKDDKLINNDKNDLKPQAGTADTRQLIFLLLSFHEGGVQYYTLREKILSLFDISQDMQDKKYLFKFADGTILPLEIMVQKDKGKWTITLATSGELKKELIAHLDDLSSAVSSKLANQEVHIDVVSLPDPSQEDGQRRQPIFAQGSDDEQISEGEENSFSQYLSGMI